MRAVDSAESLMNENGDSKGGIRSDFHRCLTPNGAGVTNASLTNVNTTYSFSTDCIVQGANKMGHYHFLIPMNRFEQAKNSINRPLGTRAEEESYLTSL